MEGESSHTHKDCDVLAVLCGEHTDTATVVSAKLEIAQEESVTYFLLRGRSSETCYNPKAAKSGDKMYDWTWDNLKKLNGGSR
jgi:hypothetical protein